MLQFPSTTMLSLSMYFPFLVKISFINFAYIGICYNAFLKGMVISNFLKISRKRAKYLSLSFLEGIKGQGISFVGKVGASFLPSLASWFLVFEFKTSPPSSLFLFFIFHFLDFFQSYFPLRFCFLFQSQLLFSLPHPHPFSLPLLLLLHSYSYLDHFLPGSW